MLIPRSIRRKVDGFRQSKGEATPKSAQPFTGSLYEVLSKESDSAKLDAWIAELPLNLQEEERKSQSWDLVHGLWPDLFFGQHPRRLNCFIRSINP